MRRALALVLPLAASACGLLADFDALSANYGDAGTPEELPDSGPGPKKEAGPSETSAPVTSPCPVPTDEGGFACETTLIESLAVSDTDAVWISQRGVVSQALAATTQTIVQRHTTAGGSTLVLHGDTFAWGYDTSVPSPIYTCAAAGCVSATPIGDPVARLRKLAPSAQGLYAWREIDHASALFRVDAPGFDPGTIGLISHFTVTDFRAHWRGGDKQKHRCDLPMCTNRLDGDSGQGPFYPLSGTNGYTSVSRADQASPLAVRICPDNEASNLVPCQLAKPLPLSTKDVDDTNIYPHEKAVAVSKDDFVYTAGADDAGDLKIGKTPAIEGAEYVPLRTLRGAEVTAIAVNTNELFVAITTATGEGHLYRFPR